jgi:Family of unknown function (DUF5318)
MRTQRQVVDYALRRRALLRDLQVGRVGIHEVCDASPYLRSAAKFHGEPTETVCPVCYREHLTNVHYIYGDELKASAGQARRLAELPVLAMTFREVQIYVVEVCRSCGWNHLIEQYLIGRDGLVDNTLPAVAAANGGAPPGRTPTRGGRRDRPSAGVAERSPRSSGRNQAAQTRGGSAE